MNLPQSESAVCFRMAPDNASASLIIPGRLGAGDVVAEDVIKLAEGQGIDVDAPVAARIREAVASFQANPRRLEEVVAKVVQPEDGEDGRLEWLEDYAPIVGRVPVPLRDESGRIDYYNCISYRSVTKGAQVAQLHEPTEGRDGHDIVGEVLKAKPGQECEVKLDACFSIDDAGRVISQRDGLLQTNGSEVQVSDVFAVKGSVDFSTGHIDFVGSVIVDDGVCDRFVVKARENVFVRGLIQAATIECGGNLCCGMGMAGRGRGRIQVAGSAEMVYLDDVNGVVKGDLHAGKELINCRIVVGANLVCPGSLIGGEVAVFGSAQVGHIGTTNGTPTTLILGASALRAVRLQNLRKEVEGLEAKLKEPARTCETLRRVRSKTSKQKNRLDKLSMEMADVRQQLEARLAMAAEIESSSPSDGSGADHATLEVLQTVFPRVRLIVGDYEVVFDGILAGPVTIGSDVRGTPRFHHGDGHERPLAEVAKVLRRADPLHRDRLAW